MVILCFVDPLDCNQSQGWGGVPMLPNNSSNSSTLEGTDAFKSQLYDSSNNIQADDVLPDHSVCSPRFGRVCNNASSTQEFSYFCVKIDNVQRVNISSNNSYCWKSDQASCSETPALRCVNFEAKTVKDTQEV
jgi:hypothetical protein